MDERIFYSYNNWKTGDFTLPTGTVQRDIHSKAVRFLLDKEILILIGLRQTGKSTLVFQLIHELLAADKAAPRDIFYFTFDDLSLRHELSESFDNLLKIVEIFLGHNLSRQNKPLYIFIDEVQKLPGFVEYMKTLYDLRYPVKWVLTGSSSLELKSQVKESLAGRAITLHVLPFTEAEIFRGAGFTMPNKEDIRSLLFGGPLPDKQRLHEYQSLLMPHKHNMERIFEDCLIFGSLPAVSLCGDVEKKQVLLRNYRDTYLEQDIRNLVKEDKLWVYQKVMELLASRIGDLLNYSNIASQLEVTVDTVKRYSMLLEKTFILKNLTTYSRNVRNEVLKSPKVYFTDMGIRNSLLGLSSRSQAERLGQAGMMLENMVINRLSSIIYLSTEDTRLHYWRTKTKEEVDFVIVTPERLLPIEVKSNNKIQVRQMKGLKSFLEKERQEAGIVIGRFEGVDIVEYGDKKIYLLPYWVI